MLILYEYSFACKHKWLAALSQNTGTSIPLLYPYLRDKYISCTVADSYKYNEAITVTYIHT